MSKTIRKLAIAFATVCVLMIMAVPSFAAGNAGWYNPGTPVTYTNPITVKVVLQSRESLTTPADYINEVYDVTLGTTNMTATSFKVIDALVALNSQQNDYEFLESTGDEIEETDSVLYNVKKVSNNHLFGPALYNSDHYPIDGWMFKVNGKFPTSTSSSTNAQGLDVSHTYIQDGDVIYFFTDYPWKDSNNVIHSAYFVSAFTEYDSEDHSLDITLKQNRDFYYGPLATATWTIQMYGLYKPTTNYQAEVRDASGTLVGTVNLVQGQGTLSCNLSSGTNYYVSVMGTRSFHSISGLDIGGSSISVNHLERTIAYDKVEH